MNTCGVAQSLIHKKEPNLGDTSLKQSPSWPPVDLHAHEKYTLVAAFHQEHERKLVPSRCHQHRHSCSTPCAFSTLRSYSINTPLTKPSGNHPDLSVSCFLYWHWMTDTSTGPGRAPAQPHCHVTLPAKVQNIILETSCPWMTYKWRPCPHLYPICYLNWNPYLGSWSRDFILSIFFVLVFRILTC